MEGKKMTKRRIGRPEEAERKRMAERTEGGRKEAR